MHVRRGSDVRKYFTLSKTMFIFEHLFLDWYDSDKNPVSLLYSCVISYLEKPEGVLAKRFHTPKKKF